MATLYLKAAGGNFGVASTWSATGSGGVDNAGVPTNADDCILEAGSGPLTISFGVTCRTLSMVAGAGDYAGTFTHQTATLTMVGSLTFSAGMTYATSATNTCLITFAASATLTTAGQLMPSINCASGTVTLADNLSFMASKQHYLALSGTGFNNGGFVISGNSQINRVFIRGGSIGIQKQISGSTTSSSFANADFRDIIFTSATNLDLSAITGLSGDCGGNTITGGGGSVTFTSPVAQTYTGGAGNWSDVSKWTSRVPLPQDNVSMSGATAGTIVADMPRLGADIDWTGAAGGTWSITTIATEIYGSVTLVPAMSLSHTSITIILSGRGTHTITSAGKTWASSSSASFQINSIGGSYTLLDAFVKGIATGGLTLVNGTFDANDFSVTLNAAVGFASTSSNTRTLIMGNGTWTISGSGGSTPWNVTSGGLTVQPEGSTIVFSDVGVGNKTFAGGSKTYNDLRLNGGGAGTVTITGTNTFNRIYTDGGGIRTVILPTTTNIVSGAGLNNGTNVITFTASGATATISKTSGTLSWDYVNLTNIPSAGGAAFYAGSHSTDGGGNTGWNFSDAPAAPGGRGSLGRVGAHTLSIGLGL